jgi:hypothetical protein
MLCRTLRLMARDRFSRSAAESVGAQLSGRPHALRLSRSLARLCASAGASQREEQQVASTDRVQAWIMAVALHSLEKNGKDLDFSKVSKPRANGT